MVGKMNIVEITNRFPTELDAVKFFEKARWGKKPKCPYCNSVRVGERNKDYRFHCKKCNKSFSVTTKTQIHNTRLPLKTWLYSIGIISDAKKGLSALQLSRNLGLNYRTTWKMYMKIRDLMQEKHPKLEGIMEMDETFIGGKPRLNADCSLPQKKRADLDEKIKELKKERGVKFINPKAKKKKCSTNVKRGRGTSNIKVVGIVERDGNVVAQVMKTLSYENLSNMVKKYVDRNKSIMITDEYKGYLPFKKIIEHLKVEHKKRVYSYKGVNTNSIESFWAIIERGLIGQYHHISPKYLPKYIMEFTFKYNNRKDDDMFETLVINSMKNK